MRGCLGIVVALMVLPYCMFNQTSQTTDANTIAITTPTNVAWWAGIIEDGFRMPLTGSYAVHVHGDNHQNQVQLFAVVQPG